jgi:sulfur-carrier protein
MAVTVRLPSILSRYAGGARALSLAGGTVGDVLAELGARHPELGQRLTEATDDRNPFVTIYLNDEDVRFLGGTGASVTDGDELSLVPAIAGG